MKYVVTIQTGDDAMRTPKEVARALEEVARKIRNKEYEVGGVEKVQDLNGNSVGTVEITR